MFDVALEYATPMDEDRARDLALVIAPDPWTTTAVYQFGQLMVAVGPRRRLVGVAVYDSNHDSVLVAVVGRHEWRDEKRRHNANQKARRARARGAV